MADLKSVLSENVDYYRDLERRLKARLAELPEGRVLKRRIKGHDYYYLKVRRGGVSFQNTLGSRNLEARQNLKMLSRMNGPRCRG